MKPHNPVIKQKHFPFVLKADAISVEFLVLHYTAASLTDTIRIFQQNRIYSHLIIDEDGTVFEMAPCLSKAGGCRKSPSRRPEFLETGQSDMAGL